MRSRAILWALPLLWSTGFCAVAQDEQSVPALEARVTDLTGTLTAEQQAALEGRLASFESRKGAQLAVLLVPTTLPEDIEQFSIRVVEKWRLGRGKVDDGALLLIAKDDRRMRIEAGYGLEGALTDAASKRIIAETITPLFRQGDFYGGINAGLDQIMRVVDGEPLPPPDQQWSGDQDVTGLLPLLFVVVIAGSAILRSVFGRGLGAVLTGGVTGGIVWLVAKLLGIAVIAGVVAAALSLFGGRSGRSWSSAARHGGWGGGWGSLGGGFGGGGGFRGGGGGFGGGGASGSW